MNKRLEQKQKTREQIREKARIVFLRKGFLQATTAEIAEAADIAHGTLFLHFSSKELLIIEILDQVLEKVSRQIEIQLSSSLDCEQMLSSYLDFLEQEEDIFVILARELPYYSDELRRKIIFRQSIIRGHIHRVIQEGITVGKLIDCHPAMAVTVFFSTVDYFLKLKPVFVEEGSVIARFKQDILEIFRKFLQKDHSS
ncbi:MAG: TetR/AcrR family transcriptional regulator [Candidatus Cloacimonetes bacterium]|nr:TetR/AcrR family transcriptional regulator [Candidatus Cloacimonadota bacterium]